MFFLRHFTVTPRRSSGSLQIRLAEQTDGMTSDFPLTSRHSIRLQGPWEVIGPGDQVRTDIRIPASWRSLFGDRTGIATFFRKFHLPTNLASSDRVFITLPDQCGTVLHVQLNGLLANPSPECPLTFEMTPHLQRNNELEVRLEWTGTVSEQVSSEKTGGEKMGSETGGLWQPVLLVIESLR